MGTTRKTKENLLPNYSCSSLRNATSLAGGNEHLVDVKPGSPLMKEINFKKKKYCD